METAKSFDSIPGQSYVYLHNSSMPVSYASTSSFFLASFLHEIADLILQHSIAITMSGRSFKSRIRRRFFPESHCPMNPSRSHPNTGSSNQESSTSKSSSRADQTTFQDAWARWESTKAKVVKKADKSVWKVSIVGILVRRIGPLYNTNGLSF